MAKSTKTQDLLNILSQKTPSAEPAAVGDARESSPRGAAARKRAPAASATRAPKPKAAAGRGKGVQFWLQPVDEKLIRELAAWLAPHRKRINDTLIVRAVLRAAKTGPQLLAAYDEALADVVRNRKPPSRAQ